MAKLLHRRPLGGSLSGASYVLCLQSACFAQDSRRWLRKRCPCASLGSLPDVEKLRFLFHEKGITRAKNQVTCKSSRIISLDAADERNALSLAGDVSGSGSWDRFRSATEGEKRNYFSAESDTATSLPRFEMDVITVILGAGAVLGAAFLVFKMLSKRVISDALRIVGIGKEKKKRRREVTARLRELARKLRTFQSVDLLGRDLGFKGLNSSAEGLGFSLSAEMVDSSANAVTEIIGIGALTKVPPTNKTSKVLNVSGDNLGDEGIISLAALLETKPGVRKLHLNSNNIGDDDAKALGELLKKNTINTVLELDSIVVDFPGFASITETLKTNKTLRAVNLDWNYGGQPGDSAFAKKLKLKRSHRELHLHGNEMGNEGVSPSTEDVPVYRRILSTLDMNLQCANLNLNSEIGNEGTEKICNIVKRTKVLSTIASGGCKIGAIETEHSANATRNFSCFSSGETSKSAFPHRRGLNLLQTRSIHEDKDPLVSRKRSPNTPPDVSIPDIRGMLSEAHSW